MRLLVPVLIVGMPAFGTLFAPAMAMLSDGAHRLERGRYVRSGTAFRQRRHRADAVSRPGYHRHEQEE